MGSDGPDMVDNRNANLFDYQNNMIPHEKKRSKIPPGGYDSDMFGGPMENNANTMRNTSSENYNCSHVSLFGPPLPALSLIEKEKLKQKSHDNTYQPRRSRKPLPVNPLT